MTEPNETPDAPATPDAPPTPDAGLSKDDKTWGMMAHLAALAGYIIPLGNVIGPLVVWLVKKNESDFVDDQGKEALNFQITVLIAYLICIPLIFILIGIFLMLAVGIYALVMVIMGAIKANEGVRFRYGISWRIIK